MALHLVVAAANDLRVPNFPNFAVGKGNGQNHAFVLLLIHNKYSYNNVSIFFTHRLRRFGDHVGNGLLGSILLVEASRILLVLR